MKLADIETNNFNEDELNSWLGYIMERLDNWHNTFTRGMIGYRIFWRTRYSDELNGLSWYGLDLMGLKCWIQH